VPADDAAGGDGCKGVRHGVYAHSAWQYGGRNVQRDEHCAILRVGKSRAVVEGRIFIPAAGLQNLEALCFERAASLKGQVHNQITFANALRAACAGVSAAVRGIENDDVESGSLWLRRRARGVGWSGNRRAGLLCWGGSDRRGLRRLCLRNKKWK